MAFSAIGLALITIVMASTMVFVLLAAIADEFGVTLRAVGWVVIVDSLIVSALLLPMGGVADALGRRRVYVWGIAVFGLGSVLTGLAPTFAVLIVARIVMAVGNALVQSVMTAMVVSTFPPEERGKAVGAQTTAVSVGAALGPLVGGLGLQVVTWQALFLLLAVPSAVSAVAALVILDPDRPSEQPPNGATTGAAFDKVGGLLSAATVVALIVTIGNPAGYRWLSAPIIAGTVAAILLLAAFVRWELGHPRPMLQLRLFAMPLFRFAVAIRFLAFLGSTTTVLLLPIFLISVRGFDDGLAGAIIFLVAVGTGLAAQISGNLTDHVGPRLPTIVGLVLQIVIAFVLGYRGETMSATTLAPVVFAAGLSVGLWNVPNNSAMMGAAPPDGLAVVGAFTNVTRTMGTVLGQAVVTAVVVGVMAGQGFDVPLSEIAETEGAARAFVDGWKVAYLVTVGFTVAALVAGLRLPPVAAAGLRSGHEHRGRP